jgi:hypothetical protein
MSGTAQAAPSVAAATAILDTDSALLVSFELSQSSWVLTVRLPGSEKMSRHSVAAGNTGAVADLLARQRAKAERLAGQPVRIELPPGFARWARAGQAKSGKARALPWTRQGHRPLEPRILKE